MTGIEINSLTKTFKGKRGATVAALKGITFTVEQGEVFGFLGPNGAGKSTTIKCLMGLLRPTSGSGSIMGQPLGTVSSRTQVGFLPENPAFYEYLSAEEYLRFVGGMFKMTPDHLGKRLEQVLTLLELQEARKRPMRSYSKGMVQRVGLAQTLIHDPQVYILDEPMSGLDPLGRALVKDIILDLKRQGKTVFFSTHITDDVEKVCDRVGVIVKGELKALESVETIMRAGVRGYRVLVRVTDTIDQLRNTFTVCRQDNSTIEFDIPAKSFNEFIGMASTLSIEIAHIETQRKDLEGFFLEIVEQGKSSV